jgi:hypothetical protein
LDAAAGLAVLPGVALVLVVTDAAGAGTEDDEAAFDGEAFDGAADTGFNNTGLELADEIGLINMAGSSSRKMLFPYYRQSPQKSSRNCPHRVFLNAFNCVAGKFDYRLALFSGEVKH